FSPRFTQPVSKRCRDPDTQTVEAVQQRSPKAIADESPQSHNNVPRTIFGLEEVRHAPGGKYAESQIVKFYVLVQSEIRRPVYPLRHHETFGEISRTNLVSDKIDTWPRWGYLSLASAARCH